MRKLMAAALLTLVPWMALADGGSPWTRLTLTESASRSVPADRLIARLRLEKQGEDPRALQSAINRQMTAALDRAKTEPEVKVEGGSYYVSASLPEPEPEPEQRAAPVWTAVQELSISGGDPGRVLGLAGALQDQGFLFSELRQELTPERQRAERETLLQQATARLRATAEATARGLGLQFLGWNRISLGGGGEPPRFRMAMAADAEMAAPRTAGADIEVSVTLEGEARLAPMP
jgi:predicted secreted protein